VRSRQKLPAVPGRKSLRKKEDWIILIHDLDTDYTTKSKIRALKLVYDTETPPKPSLRLIRTPPKPA